MHSNTKDTNYLIKELLKNIKTYIVGCEGYTGYKSIKKHQVATDKFMLNSIKVICREKKWLNPLLDICAEEGIVFDGIVMVKSLLSVSDRIKSLRIHKRTNGSVIYDYGYSKNSFEDTVITNSYSDIINLLLVTGKLGRLIRKHKYELQLTILKTLKVPKVLKMKQKQPLGSSDTLEKK